MDDACRLSGTGTLPLRTPSVRGCCGRGASGCYLTWSVSSSGFSLRHTDGNPGDRFLSIEVLT